MSENNDETTTETHEVEPTTGEPQKGNREARYRVERNEARAELATANARIERMQRAEVERLASEHLAAPADFWLSENDVSAYLTEDGEIDAELVAEDARLLISERPRLGKHTPAFDPTQGQGGVPAPKSEPSIAAMIKGAVTTPFGYHAG